MDLVKLLPFILFQLSMKCENVRSNPVATAFELMRSKRDIQSSQEVISIRNPDFVFPDELPENYKEISVNVNNSDEEENSDEYEDSTIGIGNRFILRAPSWRPSSKKRFTATHFK